MDRCRRPIAVGASPLDELIVAVSVAVPRLLIHFVLQLVGIELIETGHPSIVQYKEHLSPSQRLPSSHSSAFSVTVLPHIAPIFLSSVVNVELSNSLSHCPVFTSLHSSLSNDK